MYFDSVIELVCQYDLLLLANNAFTPGSFHFVCWIAFYFSFLFFLFSFSLLQPEFLPVTEARSLYTSKNSVSLICRTTLFRQLHQSDTRRGMSECQMVPPSSLCSGKALVVPYNQRFARVRMAWFGGPDFSVRSTEYL